MTIPTPTRALCAALALAAVAGCGIFKRDEEVAAVVNRRAIGMPAGEFFDRYGRASVKREQSDGTSEYDWTSAVGYSRPGPEGLDERICRLRLTVDGRGRVSAVAIVFDAQGRQTTSRCGEIFAAS